MKQLILTAFSILLFGTTTNAQLVFSDTTFTDPVLISFELDFVTFENCRFTNIEGTALTIEGSGVFISNCVFEDIDGMAIWSFASEVYLLGDTIRNITGDGVLAQSGVLVVLGGHFSNISETALFFNECEVAEVSAVDITDVGYGIQVVGGEGFEETLFQILHIQGVAHGDAIRVQGVDVMRLENATITDCAGWGVWAEAVGTAANPTEALVLQGNRIDRCNLGGIWVNEIQEAVIRGNEVNNPGHLSPDESKTCLYWSGKNAIIEANHLHHALNQGVGLWLAAPARVLRNHIHDCGGHGIIYANEASVESAPLLIFNNIVHDIGGPAVYFPGGVVTEPSETSIRNNTIQAVLQGDPALNPPISVCCNQNPIALEGNILVFDGEADTSKYVLLQSGGTILDQLNLKVAGDIHFVDYAGRDFHLASEDSPAHNFLQVDFGLPNDDFDGELRLGLRDAGADEIPSTATLCGCNNCPSVIPDLSIGDYRFSVVQADNNDLSSGMQGVCGVRVQFNHEYLGDLVMELISPAGQKVQLVGPNGFWGPTDNTVWDIGFVPCAAIAIPDPGFDPSWNSSQPWGNGANYTGSYYPDFGCLEDFNLGTVTGEWTLRVFDFQANDVGNILGFEVVFCNETGVACFGCTEPPTAEFVVNNVGAWGASIENQSAPGATTFLVDFGDGYTTSGPNFPPFHEYENAGTYLVRLIAVNDCGFDTAYQTVQIAGALPVAFVSVESAEGCGPQTIQSAVFQYDHVDTWHWQFPGGTPSESYEMEPASVTYNVPGQYTVSLSITNEVGSVSLQDLATVVVLPSLVNPSFTALVSGDSIICTNTTQFAESFHWSLNGGPSVGDNTSPFAFKVDSSGTYSVELWLASVCDTATVTQTVNVTIVGTNQLDRAGWRFGISPNPNDGRFRLSVLSPEDLPARVVVLNALGSEVFEEKLAVTAGEQAHVFEHGELPAGVYHLQIHTQKGSTTLRFVVQH